MEVVRKEHEVVDGWDFVINGVNGDRGWVDIGANRRDNRIVVFRMPLNY